MYKLAFVSIVLITMVSGFAKADDGSQQGPGQGPDQGPQQGQCHDCQPKTKPACFNLVCYYDNIQSPHDEFRHCKAAATFNAPVTIDGGEFQSDSRDGNNPQLEVTCDGNVIFNNSAHRYTDLLGSRIQGETGPHPAILLPRGELHSGADDHSGDHQSPSTLQLDGQDGPVSAQGTCYIWTGNP
jgi:hypothetical protein